MLIQPAECIDQLHLLHSAAGNFQQRLHIKKARMVTPQKGDQVRW